ncbi:MAG: peptide chain release factor N(5)-glutamine methyltransferase [Chitinophagaceae bacterium]|nr:peptide chain release factor N(5)-glutamine methyltransferase [Chitinophagaceae bacterium]
MDIQQAQRELLARLTPLYGEREAAQIGDLVMENITGKKKIDRLLNKDVLLSPVQTDIFHQYIFGLSKHQPVQYVLQESWFCGMKFYVDQHVLIPRPETEELVEWVTADIAAAPVTAPLSILDIGTGSGCIAIALKKRLPKTLVHACDISPEALAVARRNAGALDADIDFLQLDILDSSQWIGLPALDLIVSNPPYIPVKERSIMSPHVVDHEPHLALFVKDDNPGVFYQAIARLGQERLPPGGSLYAEIHEDLAGLVVGIFKKAGYQDITVRKDMQGKNRMVKATR